jgi:Protein of unknown function (DUF2514)
MLSELKLIAILALLAGLLVGARAAISAHDRNAVAAVQAQYAEQALKATQANDAESARREAAQADIASESQRLVSRARADSASVGVALAGLQQRTSVALGSGIAPHSPATAGSAPAPSPADLSADLLERLGELAGQLASTADERGIAGQTCERAYESLIEVTP